MTAGGAIAAFFDLDGTLLPGPSLEWRFTFYLDQSGLFNFPGWIAHAAKNIFRHPLGAFSRNKSYLAGLPETLAEDWTRSLGRGETHAASASQLAGTREGWPFFTAALRRMAWHASQRHRIFLVSGTLAPLARAAARELSRRLERMIPAGGGSPEQLAIEICATELEVSDGCWTGRLASAHTTGEEKARSIRLAATRDHIVLGESYAYGNSFADVPMLELAGHPTAVNPSLRLARAARSRGWEISRWAETPNEKNISAVKILNAKGAR